MQSILRRTAASLTGALALTLGLVGVSAGSASAVTAQSSQRVAAQGCFPERGYAVGDVCLFNGINRSGLILSAPGNLNRRTTLVGYSGRDKASSWQNYSTFRWCAFDQRTGLPDEYLFTLSPNRASNWVGNYANDRADYIEPC